MSTEGRFTLMLEQAIERSLSHPSNPTVDIFTQIIEGLRPPQSQHNRVGTPQGQSATSGQTQHNVFLPRNLGNQGSAPSSPAGVCINNTPVTKNHYQTNVPPNPCRDNYMLVAFNRSINDPELLVVAIHKEVVTNQSESQFIGQCIGCGAILSDYSTFCSHFRMAERQLVETFRYYCMTNQNGTIDPSIIPIPWPLSHQTAQNDTPPTHSNTPPIHTPGMGRSDRVEYAPMIIVPDVLKSKNKGKICILKCISNSNLSMEDNNGAIIESDFLQRCFQINSIQNPGRSILSRECMIVLLCLELSRISDHRLLWSEQLDYTFAKAKTEIQSHRL